MYNDPLSMASIYFKFYLKRTSSGYVSNKAYTMNP